MKWRVNRAVRASTLPAPSRLIMLTLSDIAHAGTAELPPERTPSTPQLAAETGLSESTVKTHRARLEADGWIVMTRPTAAEAARHVRTKYRLAVPTGSHLLTPEPGEAGSGDDRANTRAPSGANPAGGQELTDSGASSRPPIEEDDRNDLNDQPPSPPPAHSAAAEPHQPGRSEDEADDEHHAHAQQLLAELEPARLRPGRGAADLLDAVAGLLAQGWPKRELAERMTADPPDDVFNPGRFLLARLPAAGRYQPPPAARTLTTGRRMCLIHTYVELGGDGTCTSCAGDARARRDDDADLDVRPPTRQQPEPRTRHRPDEDT